MHLIQSIRLCHAIMESDYVIHVAAADQGKFAYLRNFFDLRYEIGNVGVPLLLGVTVWHEQPCTWIGEVERPLVFPESVVTRSRSLWGIARRLRFSFRGFLGSTRKAALTSWIASVTGNRIRSVDWGGPFEDLDHGLHVELSHAGRGYPEKAWDESYLRLLANSEFVLCPAGDYGWSYRFFEAILCGAIPIAEKACAAYEGFLYRLMSDEPHTLLWSQEVADHNFRLASQKLTVPRDELNEALGGELARSRAGYDVERARANPWHQACLAMRDLKALVPANETVVLVDQEEWREARTECDLRILPFLERKGSYWGPPSDDEISIREIDRMRDTGACLIAFARPCFWWLTFYSGLNAHLREHYTCVLENERLIAFDLRVRNARNTLPGPTP
jgi:hypothetical protein